MDFTEICRTCMKNNSLNPIFVSEDTRERLSGVIFSCTGVQIKFNDGLPQNMCNACMNQFNITLKFRKQCKQAETLLLKIKTELQSEHCINDENPVQFTEKSKRDISNGSTIKSEFQTVKSEPTETDVDADQSLRSFVQSKEGILLSTNSNEYKITHDNVTDDEYFNEETGSYKNENSFKIEENYQHDNEQIKLNVYSQVLEPTLSDTEDYNQSPDTTVNSDKPYIVTDTVSQKTTRVICKLCQKELSIRSIDSHMVRRHPGADERKVRCELCDKYVMREKMNRHRVMMHGSVGVKCGYCKAEFKSKEVLLDHVTICTAKVRKRKVNDSGRAIAECDICKMTMQRASLKKHKAVMHAGLRPVCEHCGKSFGNKFRLHEHYRAKHGYEKLKCGSCDFRSAGITAMRNHERRHRGEKPFVCEACGAKFHAAYLLMQHKHSHKTEKLVKCDLCPASFKANNNLHMHKLTCHSKSYYSCALCARSYKCRYYAVKHVRLVHSVSEPTSVIKLMAQ